MRPCAGRGPASVGGPSSERPGIGDHSTGSGDAPRVARLEGRATGPGRRSARTSKARGTAAVSAVHDLEYSDMLRAARFRFFIAGRVVSYSTCGWGLSENMSTRISTTV